MWDGFFVLVGRAWCLWDRSLTMAQTPVGVRWGDARERYLPIIGNGWGWLPGRWAKAGIGPMRERVSPGLGPGRKYLSKPKVSRPS